MSVLFNWKLRFAGPFFKLSGIVLLRLSTSLLLSSQKFMLSKSDFIFSTEHPTASMLVSSAKSKISTFLQTKGRSFIYIKNRRAQNRSLRDTVFDFAPIRRSTINYNLLHSITQIRVKPFPAVASNSISL